MFFILKTIGIFMVTAIAEILGCYLPYVWLRKSGGIWLLIPAALSLISFVWLLTLHPAASGRVYATYGGVYIIIALFWLKFIEKIKLNIFDLLGAAIILIGCLIIIIGWQYEP